MKIRRQLPAVYVGTSEGFRICLSKPAGKNKSVL